MMAGHEPLVRVKYRSLFDNVTSKKVYLVVPNNRYINSLNQRIYELQCKGFNKYSLEDLPSPKDVEFFLNHNKWKIFIREILSVLKYRASSILRTLLYPDVSVN
jgi:hypothetical protein